MLRKCCARPFRNIHTWSQYGKLIHWKKSNPFTNVSRQKSARKIRACLVQQVSPKVIGGNVSVVMPLGCLTEVKRINDAEAAFVASDAPATIARTISTWEVNPLFYLEENIAANSKEGRDVIRQVKMRQSQAAFRRVVLLNYGFSCCITGLPIRDVLRASHIVGWAENVKTRLLPTNGLCLAATYDAAFDRHLITFDEDFRMILSPTLREYCTNNAFKSCFKSLEGKRLLPAIKFQPSQDFLSYHRERLVK